MPAVLFVLFVLFVLSPSGKESSDLERGEDELSWLSSDVWVEPNDAEGEEVDVSWACEGALDEKNTRRMSVSGIERRIPGVQGRGLRVHRVIPAKRENSVIDIFSSSLTLGKPDCAHVIRSSVICHFVVRRWRWLYLRGDRADRCWESELQDVLTTS